MIGQFQSTRPRGARQYHHSRAIQALRFNPRARVGRDLLQFFLTLRGVKFQSTRPRGARRGKAGLTEKELYSFNPRARVGRDLMNVAGFIIIYLFQSTRPRGARRILPYCHTDPKRFQSTRPRGARRMPIGERY